MKGAGAIEALGRARTVLFDKTGTLTVGVPVVRDVLTHGAPPTGELLRLAASVDRLSAHVLGDALVRAAAAEGLMLAPVTEVQETPGQGIAGTVGGRRVVVGSRAFLRSAGLAPDGLESALFGRGSGEAHVLVGVDGHVAGAIVMADELRPDATGVVARLRAEGVRHIAIVSGDRASAAERAARELGADRAYADLTPEGKLAILHGLSADPRLSPVIMVGDGINDAPALAAAHVGIAMGAAGATVSTETADAVVTVDRVDRVADAVHAGRRAVRIARQSVLAGMAMSFAAMAVAAAGALAPVAGALVQETIDLAVILNALRALRG